VAGSNDDEKANNTWKYLNLKAKAQYETAKLSLHQCFEPDYRRDHRISHKRVSGWADSLGLLAHRAFPEFEDAAKKQLSLDRFLSLLDEPKLVL